VGDRPEAADDEPERLPELIRRREHPRAELLHRENEHLEITRCDHGRRPHATAERADLAEELPCRERRDPLPLLDHLGRPGEHDEGFLGGITGREHDRPGREEAHVGWADDRTAAHRRATTAVSRLRSPMRS
jgi:hypothetical protein